MSEYKSGLVGIIGRPNVGKSTLLNQILGQKLAIVTPRPQTTRQKIMGIATYPDCQIMFLDTPGIHEGQKSLNRVMVEAAFSTLDESDAILYLVDTPEVVGRRRMVSTGNAAILERLRNSPLPIILVFNKVDQVKKAPLLPAIEAFNSLHKFAAIVPISALHGDGVDALLEETKKLLPEGQKFFPDGELTDRSLRFIASEFIREKALLKTRQEVPYSVAVTIETMEEREGKRPLLYIMARIHVERKSQKGIIIGKQGAMIKQIGTEAREELQKYLKRRVHLELLVRVEKNWTQSMKGLKRVEYET